MGHCQTTKKNKKKGIRDMVWKPDGRKRVEGTCVPSQIRILGWGNWQHLMALVDVSGQAIWRQLFWLRILCIGTLVTYGLTRMAVPVESVSAISVVRCGCGEWRDLSGVKISIYSQQETNICTPDKCRLSLGNLCSIRDSLLDTQQRDDAVPIAIRAQHKGLAVDAGNSAVAQIHGGNNLPADQLVRFVIMGYLGRARLRADLGAKVDGQLVCGLACFRVGRRGRDGADAEVKRGEVGRGHVRKMAVLQLRFLGWI